MSRESCEGCVHYKNLTGDYRDTKKYCNYLLDTSNKRECSPDNCDKKESMSKEENIKYKKLIWMFNSFNNM